MNYKDNEQTSTQVKGYSTIIVEDDTEEKQGDEHTIISEERRICCYSDSKWTKWILCTSVVSIFIILGTIFILVALERKTD